jgi:hypothetical protein
MVRITLLSSVRVDAIDAAFDGIQEADFLVNQATPVCFMGLSAARKKPRFVFVLVFREMCLIVIVNSDWEQTPPDPPIIMVCYNAYSHLIPVACPALIVFNETACLPARGKK